MSDLNLAIQNGWGDTPQEKLLADEAEHMTQAHSATLPATRPSRPLTKTGNKHGHHWVTDVRRLSIYLKHGLACAYCHIGVEQGATLTLDHIRPRANGGTNESRNLLTACMSCNARRGKRSFRRFCLDAGVCPNALRRLARRNLDTDAARSLIAARGTLSAAVYGDVCR